MSSLLALRFTPCLCLFLVLHFCSVHNEIFLLLLSGEAATNRFATQTWSEILRKWRIRNGKFRKVEAGTEAASGDTDRCILLLMMSSFILRFKNYGTHWMIMHGEKRLMKLKLWFWQSGKMQERGWKPRWFAKQKGNSDTYCFVGGYWEAKEEGRWESCPDIFGRVPTDIQIFWPVS